MTDREYRGDIDGIRAIAILLAIGFHTGVEGFRGGYIGVDLFFVISGFLITSLIQNEVRRTGTLDFKAFYLRRARRLLPAMLATLVITSFAVPFIFPPQVLQSFAQSVIAAVVSVSNFLFWSEAGYFDRSAFTKPLLHTWSLGVEEQYYLFWPFLLYLLVRRTGGEVSKRAVLVVAALGMLSLAWNIDLAYLDGVATKALLPGGDVLAQDGLASIYFLLPFRIFEFMIGVALLWIAKYPYRPKGLFADLCIAASFAALTYCVFVFSKRTPFPSFWALIPCLAVALMMYAGPQSRLVKIYDNALMILIGRMSYAIYLIHWPIIVLYVYANDFRKLTPTEQAVLIPAILAAGALIYFLIETPLRRPRPGGFFTGKRFLAGAAGLAAILIACSTQIVLSDGWTWRYSPRIVQLIRTNIDSEKNVLPTKKECFMQPSMNYRDISPSCYDVDKTSPRGSIMLYGDSTVYHLVPGLSAVLGKDYDIYMFSSASCPSIKNYVDAEVPHCAENNAFFQDVVLKRNRYDLVIVSNTSRWLEVIAGFPVTQAALVQNGSPYILLGQLPYFSTPTDQLVARFGVFNGLLEKGMKNSLALPCNTDEYEIDELVPPKRFFSMKQQLCSKDGFPLYQLDGYLIHSDHIHFNEAGSVWMAHRLSDWLHAGGYLKPGVVAGTSPVGSAPAGTP